jgi:hypothetical protein
MPVRLESAARAFVATAGRAAMTLATGTLRQPLRATG